MREKDPDKKKLMRQELSKNDLPKYFGYLEDLLKEENIWFSNNKMTIADIAIWRLMGWLKSGVIDDIPQDITDDFNKLNNFTKHKNTIMPRPNHSQSPTIQIASISSLPCVPF